MRSWLKDKLEQFTDTEFKEEFEKELRDFAQTAKLTRRFKKDVVKIAVRAQKDEYLIFDHTHEPFLDKRLKMANAGCWYKERCTFLTIDEKKVVRSKLEGVSYSYVQFPIS